GLTAARARPTPDPGGVRRFVFAEPLRPGDAVAIGGLRDEVRTALDGSTAAHSSGETLRFAEAIRRTLQHGLAVNPRVLVFGEDVGVKGGVHLVTEGL